MRQPRRSNEERREQSTEQVLAAALQRFVADGYERTSIDGIARQAGLTKGAIYFYFRGKVALLEALLKTSEALYADIFTTMRGSAEDAPAQLGLFADWCATAGAENKDLLLLPILVSLEFAGRDDAIEQQVRGMYDRYHREMERVVREGQAAGTFDNELAPAERAAALVALTDGMLLEWHRFGDRLNGRSLARSARAQMLGGVLKAP